MWELAYYQPVKKKLILDTKTIRQELFYGKRYEATNIEQAPDFVKLAESYGAVGLRATKVEEVVPVLKKGLATANMVIMDFWVDREECVYPMVPAGAPISEMLLV